MKTLKERTEIQQAYLDGASIEYNDVRNDESWSCCYGEPSFVWVNYDYRIKPEPMEIWVNIYGDGSHAGYNEKDRAKTLALREDVKRVAVKFIEVIDETH